MTLGPVRVMEAGVAVMTCVEEVLYVNQMSLPACAVVLSYYYAKELLCTHFLNKAVSM